jgi:hypothetical protein
MLIKLLIKVIPTHDECSVLFDSLVVCVAWCIWRERNDRVFSGSARTAAGVVCVVWDMLQRWCQARLLVGPMLVGE